MAASCSLLGAPALAQDASDTAAGGERPWQLDTGLLYYKEDGGRITDIEPEVLLRRDFGDERLLTLTGVFDSLSGGSPNGALPSKIPQTFATPSGTSLLPPAGGAGRKSKLYTTDPGQLPMDPNFRNERIAADLSWSQPFADANHVTVGGHLSKEHDFFSAAGNMSVARDFNTKNTTVGLGLNAESDRVDPVGGAPVAGSDYALLERQGNKSKSITSGLLSLTQVVNRIWLAQLNLTYDRASGYLTDPYKILSVLDSIGATSSYVFENRPAERARKGAYFGNKVALGLTVLEVSYRYTTDDWAVKSDTVDAKLRFNLGSDRLYLEPHVRWYRQSAASFYHLYLDTADANPEYVSSDSRLAAFGAATVGVKLGYRLEDKSEISIRLEAYQQKPSQTASSLPELAGLDLNPGLKTVLLQISWHNGSM